VVKLNNILLAQSLFDDMLTQMEETGGLTGEVKVPTARITIPGTAHYQVKVISAKNLALHGYKCPDAYLVSVGITSGHDA
jgi:hypothetical protein